MDVFRSLWYRLVVLLQTAAVAVIWHGGGPGQPLLPLMVLTWTFVLDPVLVYPAERFMPAHWFRVPQGEHLIHRVFGIPVFGRLLERAGWNALVVRPLLKEGGYRPGTKASLAFRANSARSGGAAHAVCFAIHLLLSADALFSGYPRAALWLLLPGVVIHLYPTLLQRSILLRLQPLLDRTAARRT